MSVKRFLPLFLIVAAALFLYLFRLGGWPLYDYDEATYGRVALETLHAGDWLTLHDIKGPWFEKPPLYIWAVMTSVKTFGASEWSIRLPSALFGVLAIALVYLVVFELTENTVAASLAAVALLCMPFFYFEGRQSRMDIPVIAAILFAFLAFIKGRKRETWFLAMGVGIAVGVLIKSVIGLLVGVPIILFAIFFSEWRWLKNKYFWFGGILAVLLILPWHLYELSRFGNTFWNIYFTQQVFTRAVAGFGGGITTGVYLMQLWANFAPWTQASLAFLALFLMTKTGFAKFQDPRTKTAFIGIGTAAVYFLFFAAARTKLVTYLLPMYPFVAIFVAVGFSLLLDLSARQGWPRAVWWAILLAVFSMGFYYTVKIQFVDFDAIYPFVYDERDVGSLIKDFAATNPSEPVYTDRVAYVETLLFYGRTPLTPLVPGAPLPKDKFELVALSDALPELIATPRLANARVAYQGDYLLLLLVGPAAKP